MPAVPTSSAELSALRPVPDIQYRRQPISAGTVGQSERGRLFSVPAPSYRPLGDHEQVGVLFRQLLPYGWGEERQEGGEEFKKSSKNGKKKRRGGRGGRAAAF